MIQRIQTIFLLLATAAFGGLFSLPFATSQPVSEAGRIFSDGSYNIFDNLVLVVLVVLGALFGIIAIFMYGNRKTQMKLGYLAAVVSILLMVVSYLFFTNQAPAMSEAPVNDAAGMYLPAAALVCVLLANYFIRKDEQKVRSMDRLR